WPLLALIGWTNFALRTAILSPHDMRVVAGNEPALATVHGTLAETPHFKIIERDDGEHWRSVVRVKVREIARGGPFQAAEGEILATTPGVLDGSYFAGQPVEISGVIAPPPAPVAPGLFDYRDYLAIRGIYYQLKTDSTNDWKLLDPHSLRRPLTDRFLDWSKKTLALGLPAEDEPLRLLWAMTLGWRTAFTGEVSEPFIRAGTQHMFAIDGLRIALVSGMIVTLLRVLRLSRAWCGAIAVPAIWFYTAATGWESSAVRASVMMTVVLGGWALKRPGDLVNSLAAAAFIILLAEPRQLLEAGFQLSFMVMLVIALVLPVWNDFFDRLLRQDQLLPLALVPAWKQKAMRWARHLARYCGLSFAAWLGSIPLAAKYFHMVSPVSTLANLLAVPLGTLALMANLGALICGHWLHWLTELFNHAAWFFMVAMTWVSVKSAELPGAYFYVPEPSLTTMVIYYGVVIAAFSGWFKTKRRKIAGAVTLLVIAAVYLVQWQWSRQQTEFTVLPANGGHVVFVDAAGRQNDWLINCGNENAVDFTLKDFLRGHGVNSVARLVLADAETRNIGGTKRLRELFPIQECWTSGAKFRTAAYREAVSELDKPTIDRKILQMEDTAGIWQVLYPPANDYAKAEDGALVLRGNIQGTRIVLLNDLSRSGQSALVGKTNDLCADIVIAGLPNEGEPLCDALLQAIQPKAIIVADSEFPATRRASVALHERLARKHVPVYYTRTAGAVTIIVGPHGWQVRNP
ncbi:MAG TPA: ComEC/Rec2 family competence protein, partial [Verrucomicrobiae bacterium]